MKQDSLSLYQPNFANKRVKDRINTVLTWCDYHLNSNSPTQVHHDELAKVFGTASNQMSHYLRGQLLVRSGVYVPGVSSFSYTLIQDGYDKLAAKVGRSGNHIQNSISFREEMEKKYPGLAELQFEYSEKSHRLYHGLQNMKADKKKEFWNNYLPFNYDVDACAPTILLQLARQFGMLPLLAGPIQNYLDDKEVMRSHVAELVQVDAKTAKRIINSLFNGARLAANGFCSTFKALDYRVDLMRALQNDQEIISLRAAIKQMWAAIATKFEVKSSKDKWAVYFKMERKVLDAVKFFLDEKDASYFTEHDGFRSSEQIDVIELSDYVFAKTGIRVNFSEEDKEKKEKKEENDGTNNDSTHNSIWLPLPKNDDDEGDSITTILNKRRCKPRSYMVATSL